MAKNTYEQKTLEKKWQTYWKENNIYHFNPESTKQIYSIDVPPRYASGPLHAGHAVHYTHIDFAARYKRMCGYNVFFPLCFDVNGIPIEERVERQRNITRKDINRHEFTKLCSDFAEKNIKTMIEQFYILGESMDPSIYYQTDAKYYRRITQLSFIELYNKGLIYKGKFPVNWCPRCMTAMADAEVTYKENKTTLNTIKFYFKNNQNDQIQTYHGIGKDKQGTYIEIATTRPELLPSCQIVAIHPTDERTPWLVDQEVKVPLFDKYVKIVSDDAVDPDFGTGMVMICTIGDKEDLNWVFKYHLPLEMSISEEGTMTALAGKYEGMKIKEARSACIADLKDQDLLIDQNDLDQNVGACWRCKTPVEFINANQWFLKTTKFKEMVLKASDDMNWFPEFMKIRLEEWVNSLEWDWVISRQRYFATPIPLWECKDCEEVILAKPEDCYVDPTIDKPAVDKCPKCGGDLIGSEDVFDTWMDSSISPLYNTFWHRDDSLFKKMYPMSLRPQAHDIIRTWAFYTILRCSLLTDEKPFENIMMGGFILSEDGTPMHASLGNVIDPLKVINEFGSDAFRCYAANCSLGEDNAFRRKDVIRGKKLIRKLWNVEQFIGSNINTKESIEKPENLTIVDTWILTKYSRLIKQTTELLEHFDYSQAMKEIEYFLWHEFADHYIEMAKSSIYNDKHVNSTTFTLQTIGLGILKLFAPFIPHITEELYQLMYKKSEESKSIHISSWPEPIIENDNAHKSGETIKKFIANIRSFKSEQGIALNAPLKSSATYGPKDLIEQLESQKELIKSTLSLPDNHSFIEGKPDIEESITRIEPVYAKIGPIFKKDSQRIAAYIKNHQQDLISKIEETGDLKWKDIPDATAANPEESLLNKEFVTLKRKSHVTGSAADETLVTFEPFYVLVSTEVTTSN
ncbi:MAG TPA: valine--tRNA ligase [Candidatus Thermoplasmatota archaeon]|nr:valine--tRNA ligase [Candidatus Thermoplasmatota archaeon]